MRHSVGLAVLVVGLGACGNPQPETRRPIPNIAMTDAATDGSAASLAAGAVLPLVPQPRAMKRCDGALAIDPSTTRIAVEDSPEARATGEQLARWLGLTATSIEVISNLAPDPPSGIAVRTAPSASATAATAVMRDAAIHPPRSVDDEAYSLDISPKRAVLRARWPAGLAQGALTIEQLAGARKIGVDPPPLAAAGTSNLPPRRWTLPCVTINDAPRFPIRAMHLDVARHFFSKQVVKRYIDLLAFYRFNVFHWHLTDDQGFRLDLKSHPELAKVGGADGFFTESDVNEIVQYARDRFITVVPEIEMPGHSRAILAAHPELSCTGKKQDVPRTSGVFEDVLCAGNDKTFTLLTEVLTEVASLFPSSLIHIGGDEVPTTSWSACPKCRAAMKKASITNVSELEGVFLASITSTLSGLGKRAIVWDEAISDRLASDVMVAAWQSTDRGKEAAQRLHDVVMVPVDQVYFNYHQSTAKGIEPGHADRVIPWTKVYSFTPIPEGLEPSKALHIVGGEGTLWTEHVETQDHIDTLVMPRMAVLAEVLWVGADRTGGSDRMGAELQDFIARFNAQLPVLDASSVKYFVEPPTGLREKKIIIEGDTTTVDIKAPRLFAVPRTLGVVRFTLDGSDPSASSPTFEAPLTIRDTTTLSTAFFLPSGRSSAIIRSSIVKEQPRKATPAFNPSLPGALYTYVEGDFHRLPDFDKGTGAAKKEIQIERRGRVDLMTLVSVGKMLGPKMRKDHFAVRFEGFFRAPKDGVYHIVARADDGVRVEIDRTKVVEDDGEHAARESDGEIALAQGLHAVSIFYFQAAESMDLDVKIEGPDLPLGPFEVTSGL